VRGTAGEIEPRESPKLVSVVVPVYCEEGIVERAHTELTAVLRGLRGYRYELVFVDDGSSDGTGRILRRLAAADARLKVVAFSRNFGHQIARSSSPNTSLRR